MSFSDCSSSASFSFSSSLLLLLMMLLLLLRLFYSDYILCQQKQPLYTPSSATHLQLPGLSLSGTFPDFLTIAGPPSSALPRTAAVCGRKRVAAGRRHARNPPHQPQPRHQPHCADRRADRPNNQSPHCFLPPPQICPGHSNPSVHRTPSSGPTPGFRRRVSLLVCCLVPVARGSGRSLPAPHAIIW